MDICTAHQAVANQIVALLDKKRHDYGENNIRKFGSYGILIRVSDKVERLINLTKKEEPLNESVEETWRDIAGYAILALVELEHEKERKKCK